MSLSLYSYNIMVEGRNPGGEQKKLDLLFLCTNAFRNHVAKFHKSCKLQTKTAKPLLMQSASFKFIYVTLPIGQHLLLTEEICISLYVSFKRTVVTFFRYGQKCMAMYFVKGSVPKKTDVL